MSDIFDATGTNARKIADWIQTNAGWLGIIVPLVSAELLHFKRWHDRRPLLRFELVEATGNTFEEGDEPITVKVRNLGGTFATVRRCRWTQYFDCRLDPVSAPFFLTPGESKELTFHINGLELAVQQIPFPDRPPLGKLEVYSDGPIGSTRRAGFVLASKTEELGFGTRGITLLDLPPLMAHERWGLVARIHTAITKPDKQMREYEAAHARGRARHLANSVSILRRRKVLPPNSTDLSRGFLINELARRGWSWKLETRESDYGVEVSKTWPPSSNWSIVSFGESVEVALIKSLAAAIKADEEVLIPPRKWPDDSPVPVSSASTR